MTFAMPEIAARLFDTPLMLHEAKANIIARSFGPRVLGQDVAMADTPEMGVLSQNMRELRDGWTGEKIYAGPKMVGNVAVIEVEGSLVNKGSWVGKTSGMTSYEGLNIQIADCLARDDIKAAVFEFDSFGGEVDGCFACAEELHALSQEKPTIAILTDHACSAAYLLAAACRQIVIPATGYTGSIGVITMHVDASGWAKNQGLAVTILRAGEKKARPGMFEAMSEEEYSEAVSDLEAMRSLFAETVSLYRGPRLSVEAALATQADTFRGQAAVDLGLADAVGRPKQVFEAFLAAMSA
ncbi:S49 family peptidase [Bacillus subtilis]|uniref:S49 family peptidase n=1 Tax=Pseudochrobactrum asaccharolyticum TaxID=354351 RepID=UPI001F393130|nr:S49 family peptidase [Pseudochrobactrum asaccharolyticum]MCF7645022.1 S49 family peptidase [Pseudochrobactrum asaccharolyticum]MCF7671551.1 S49 family peptidase [Bacillus subtilis]